jgi:hypothetical protein
MLKLPRRKPPTNQINELLGLRRQLFAMDNLTTIVDGLSAAERQEQTWSLFISAAKKVAADQKTAAINDLRQVLELPALSTRIYLLAWNNLRALGVSPDEAAGKQVCGIVLETPTKDSRNLLAAYADHTVFSMAAEDKPVAWNLPDPELGILVDDLLASGRPLLERAHPWDKPEPGPPPPGFARLSILTAAGLHFGQGPLKFLNKDKLGGEVVRRANGLIRFLNQKNSNGN